MSLADELLSGVPGGLRQTAAQENLCILFQRAGGEEDGLPDEENTSENERKRAEGGDLSRGYRRLNCDRTRSF